MDIPRYHTCASLPACRIYVHLFRNSFGLIDLCRLSRDTRLTSDSCSSGWSFVIGFLHQGRCLPRLARFTRPSPVRADSGLSPHRHTCAAGRSKKTPCRREANRAGGCNKQPSRTNCFLKHPHGKTLEKGTDRLRVRSVPCDPMTNRVTSSDHQKLMRRLPMMPCESTSEPQAPV